MTNANYTESDLESHLKSKTYWSPDTRPLQESIDVIVADLRSEGKKFVITKVLADNTTWIGKKITVLDENGESKELSVIYKPIHSVYHLQVEYYDPDEVK